MHDLISTSPHSCRLQLWVQFSFTRCDIQTATAWLIHSGGDKGVIMNVSRLIRGRRRAIGMIGFSQDTCNKRTYAYG